jgi:hypothetical protein
VAANFNADMIEEAAAMQLFRSEQAHREPAVMTLAAFHPDDFDMHEDAFMYLLVQSFGAIQEPIRYVVRSEVVPTTFVTTLHEVTKCTTTDGGSFELELDIDAFPLC